MAVRLVVDRLAGRGHSMMLMQACILRPCLGHMVVPAGAEQHAGRGDALDGYRQHQDAQQEKSAQLFHAGDYSRNYLLCSSKLRESGIAGNFT